MDDVIWLDELTKRDTDSLLDDSNTTELVDVALDALAQVQIEYPSFYKRAGDDPATKRVLIRIITDVAFRKGRNSQTSGFSSERDGVYSYTMSGLSASANIWFPKADIATMTATDDNRFAGRAFGSIRRKGI